jgi:hypothetical protein
MVPRARVIEAGDEFRAGDDSEEALETSEME